MQKPYKDNEKSEKQCCVPGCKTFLKKNLLHKIPDADKCFYHHAKLVRNNPKYLSPAERLAYPQNTTPIV